MIYQLHKKFSERSKGDEFLIYMLGLIYVPQVDFIEFKE